MFPASLLFHNSLTLPSIRSCYFPKKPKKPTARKGRLRHGPSKFWNPCFFCFFCFFVFSRGFLFLHFSKQKPAGRPSCRSPWAPKCLTSLGKPDRPGQAWAGLGPISSGTFVFFVGFLVFQELFWFLHLLIQKWPRQA